MIRKLIIMVFAVFAANVLFGQSGTIKGKVLDGDTGEAIPFANVSVLQDGKVITGGMTDFDGKFTIKPVPVGKFTVNASYMGYSTIALNNVQVNNNKITFQDFKLPSSVSKIDEVVVVEYKVPLISKDQVESGGTISQEDIDKMPGRSATAVAATVGGVSSDADGNLNVRGARSEGTVYYIDGVKVMGNTLPKSAIEQINVITGGLAAKYGDATGGIVNITTKGASKDFHGGVELITSEFVDGLGYNLGGMSLTGPIYSKKSVDPYDSTKINKKPIVGFLLTGDVNYYRHPSPNMLGTYAANDGVRESMLETPYVLDETSGIPVITSTSDYFGADKFTNQKTKTNNALLSINTSGKININASENLLFSIGGRYRYVDRSLYSKANSLFNSENNGHNSYNNWAVNARVTHKLSNRTEEEEKKSASVLKNVYYQLVASYEKQADKYYNKDFDDEFFHYGHVGKFTTNKMETYEFTTQLPGFANGVYEMNGHADTSVWFSPSQYNPELSAYTDYYYSLFQQGSPFLMNKNLIESTGGILNGQNPKGVYDYGGGVTFNSPGTPYNGYSISDNTQIIISGNGSADVGDHEFQIGFEFEQRENSAYSLSPRGLWVLGRQLANFHLQNLDKSNPILHYVKDGNGDFVLDMNGNRIFADTISYERLYSAGSQTMFDKKFRQYLAGQGASIDGEAVTVTGSQFLDVDSYDPEDLSVEYFSEQTPYDLVCGGWGSVC